MIISKKEARKRELKWGFVCPFHENNPDQVGIESCDECVIIRDKCGCDGQMECERCGESL